MFKFKWNQLMKTFSNWLKLRVVICYNKIDLKTNASFFGCWISNWRHSLMDIIKQEESSTLTLEMSITSWSFGNLKLMHAPNWFSLVNLVIEISKRLKIPLTCFVERLSIKNKSGIIKHANQKADDCSALPTL